MARLLASQDTDWNRRTARKIRKLQIEWETGEADIPIEDREDQVARKLQSLANGIDLFWLRD